MAIRPVNRDCPEEREAALRLLRMIGDSRLSLDDILSHGLILEKHGETLRVVNGLPVKVVFDEIQVCVGGIPMRCEVWQPTEER